MQLLCLIFFFLLIGCSENSHQVQTEETKDGHIIRREFNDKGILTYEQQFLKNDTGLIEDGFVRVYSDNGDTLETGFFDSGRFDGVSKLFHPNGTLKQKLKWKFNAMWGPQYEYYDNGSLRLFKHYLDPVVPDSFIVNKFMIHFDVNNDVDTVSGHAFLIYTEEQYQASDTAAIVFFYIGDPDGMKGRLAITIRSNGMLTTDTFSQANSKVFFDQLIFQYRYPCIKGTAKLEAKYILQTSKKSTPIVCDSQVVQINVGK